MRRIHGYESYRGRSGARSALLIIIAILLVVLLLAVAAFFVLQKYVVYTDDGRARVVLPFLEEREPEPTPDQDPVVIVTEGPLDPEDPLVTGQPQETAEPVFAVALPRTALTDGSAAAAVAAGGGNAALFDMKGDDGYLAYVSALPEALNLATSAADSRINEGIRAMNETELYTIARISCFRDNRVPRMDNALAIRTTGGYNWFDPQDLRWTDPGNAYIQGYLVGVCRELAQLGFDELLLDFASYPAQGQLDIIRRPEGQTGTDRTAVLREFYAAVRDALAEFPEVKLSIAASPAAPEGAEEASGQNAGLLTEFADRIYVPAGAPADGLREAGADPGCLVLTTVPADYRFDAAEPVLPRDAGGIVLPVN